MTIFTPELIASWPPPNYVNPVTLDPAIFTVNSIYITVCTLCIRVYSRLRIVMTNLGADDWIMVAAYFFSIALFITHMAETKYGVGRHLYDINLATAPPAIGKIALVKQSILNIAVVLTRISICLSYLRLFPLSTNKWFCYGTIAALAGYGISSGLIIGLQCRHVADEWQLNAYNNSCIDRSAFYNWQTAMNAVFDLLVFLWPVRYLWGVQIPRRTRLALIVCFSFGVIICVLATVRIWLTVVYYNSWDLTWKGAIIYMLVSTEVMLGILCGSLPNIRPIIVKPTAGSTIGTYTRTHDSNNNTRRHTRKAEVWELEEDMTPADSSRSVDLEVREIHITDTEKLSRTSHGRDGSQERIIPQ